MARYLGPTCRISRREKIDLGFKSGIREFDKKCKTDRSPGQHWQKRQKVNEYGSQLRMKQMIRKYYGILEKQFVNYYKKAEKMSGSTGENLLKILECRLDNVVYRMGFASTRAEARQLVSHRLILVNSNMVNIPSFLVNELDSIEVAKKAKTQLRITKALSMDRGRPTWVQVDEEKLAGKVKSIPSAQELPGEFKTNLVVELYSK